MNYQNIYNSIINNAQCENRRKKDSYYEKHHIVPKCIGGVDNKPNLVLLTAKEHFICHRLLTKIHPLSNKLHSAFWMMLNCESENQQRYKSTAKVYEISKERQSSIMSKKWKLNNPNTNRDHSGENNPMYGVHRFGTDNPFYGKSHSKETIDKIKKSKANNPKVWSDEEKKKLSDSWIGRPIIECPHCTKTSKHVGNMKRYHFDNCKSKQ